MLQVIVASMTAFRQLVLALCTLTLFGGLALAGPVNVDADGLALEGHDPVAYFTENMPVKGSAEFSATHDGATYQFASAENKALFEAEPARYAPQYGGFCAFGLSYGSRAPVEIDKFSIVDGKLYLNFNGDIQSRWQQDVPGYIEKANANWSKIE